MLGRGITMTIKDDFLLLIRNKDIEGLELLIASEEGRQCFNDNFTELFQKMNKPSILDPYPFSFDVLEFLLENSSIQEQSEVAPQLDKMISGLTGEQFGELLEHQYAQLFIKNNLEHVIKGILNHKSASHSMMTSLTLKFKNSDEVLSCLGVVDILVKQNKLKCAELLLSSIDDVKLLEKILIYVKNAYADTLKYWNENGMAPYDWHPEYFDMLNDDSIPLDQPRRLIRKNDRHTLDLFHEEYLAFAEMKKLQRVTVDALSLAGYDRGETALIPDVIALIVPYVTPGPLNEGDIIERVESIRNKAIIFTEAESNTFGSEDTSEEFSSDYEKEYDIKEPVNLRNYTIS